MIDGTEIAEILGEIFCFDDNFAGVTHVALPPFARTNPEFS